MTEFMIDDRRPRGTLYENENAKTDARRTKTAEKNIFSAIAFSMLDALEDGKKKQQQKSGAILGQLPDKKTKWRNKSFP
jgi:hypothetical protein